MRVERLSNVAGFVFMLVVFAFSCSSPSVKSPHNAEQEPLRTSLSENSSYPIESQLTEILDHVQPWLDHILPWPDYSTNFLNASWDGLVLAARVIQENNPERVEKAIRNFQSTPTNKNDGKLLLLMRVAFDLPETRPLGDNGNGRPSAWIPAFGGWMDTSGSDNRRTNAAWPISWNGGKPKLVVGFTSFQGPAHDAAAEYRYMRSKYPMRNLATYSGKQLPKKK